jgi:hypothetical protein
MTRTFLEAAHLVLVQAGRPMDIKEIKKEVYRRNLWKSRAKPQYVLNSLYGTLIKACQAGDSRFERLDNGPYFVAR